MTKFVTPENNKKAVFPVFPVPIYINRLTDDREFNQELVQKVETLRNSDPEGVEICKKEYRNGYTSFFSLNQIQKDAEFSEITEQILRHGRFFAQTMGFSTENPPLNLTTMFGTITSKGCHHELHRHRNSLISGTYYVSANKTSSRISFLDPKAGFRMHEPGGQTGQTIFSNLEFSVQPQSGLIVMFPSFLEHRVEMQQNDIPRVGITFNLDLIRDEDC
ncbi:MAG: TIGR02466 family protein [Gammaproteobacteria bacterium]|nr:TIGR02466 family protein [Gammaproteobacteria bacterium]